MAKQTFTTGQVLTAAQMTSLQQTAMGGGSATAKTASYVLVAADAGTTVAMNAAGATTITVNTGLFAAGDTVFIQNLGAGACTVTAGTATVATAGSLILPQNDAGILYFTATGASIFYDYIQAGAVSPLTTKGDLYTFSTSDDRLAVGADGTTLVADSSEATGLKWQAASASGLTFISRTTFSTSSAVTIDNLFSDTYENYLIRIQASVTTAPATLQLQFRYGSTTHVGANYDYAFSGVDATANTFRVIRNYGQTQILLEVMNTTPVSLMDLNICRLNGSAKIQLTGTLWGQENIRGMAGGAYVGSSQAWSGILLTPASSTITGQVTVYGLAKS